MEPNKLEKHFKEQLNSREIQPSEMAWNKLDAMLTVAEPSNIEQAKQKPKTKFPWMYIAASFAGFVLLGTVYFKQNDNPTQKIINEVVLKNKVEPQINTATKTIITPEHEAKQELVATLVSKIDSVKSKTIITKEKSNVVTFNSNQNQVVEGSIKNLLKEKNTDSNSIQENYQVINKNRYISAEKLLAEVTNTKLESKSMDKSANVNTTSIAVNPNLLLQNVETELNQSFRESALNRLNKNFKTIKTVLANRNYEE